MWIRIQKNWPSAPTFFSSDLKNIISCEKKRFCWLNSAFPFILSVILYLWIRIRIHVPKWIRIRFYITDLKAQWTVIWNVRYVCKVSLLLHAV